MIAEIMIPEAYHAYHEAGHALAMHCSTKFDVDFIELDDPLGWYVRLKWRSAPDNSPSRIAYAEKAFIALAGEYAGRRYLRSQGCTETNSLIETGLEGDRNSAETQLTNLASQDSMKQLQSANEAFFDNFDVWRGVDLIARQIIKQDSGRILGSAVAALLQDVIPAQGQLSRYISFLI